jgi:hypothetical protein
MRLLPVVLAFFLSASSGALQTLLPAAQPKEPVPNNREANHARDKCRSHEQDKLNTGGSASGVKGQPKGDAEEEYPNTQSTDRIYRIEIVSQPRDSWYVTYVVLTALTFVVLLGTLFMVYRQTDFARRAERAWITTEHDINEFTVNGNFIYPINLKNFGQSPARVIRAGASMKKIDSLSHIPPQPTYEPHEILSFNHMLVVPQDHFYLTTELGMTAAEHALLANNPPTLFLYAHGFVEYVDAFGIKRETRFCLRYFVSGPNEPTMKGFQRYSQAPSYYNEAT